MALAIEHHHRQVLDPAILRPGDPLEVLGDRGGDVDHLRRGRSDDELLHVVEVGVEHRAPLGEGDGRDAPGDAARDQARAVDRVHRDVDGRRVAVADLLADVEHRRLVLLALADDHHAVHVDESEAPAHRVDGGLVGYLLLIAPHVPSRGHRGALGDADQLERKVAVDRCPQIARPSAHQPAIIRCRSRRDPRCRKRRSRPRRTRSPPRAPRSKVASSVALERGQRTRGSRPRARRPRRWDRRPA